jgi:hypothetical protein
MKEGAIGDVAASEQGDSGWNGSAPEQPRLLAFTHADDGPGFGRVVSALLERDHHVVLVAQQRRRAAESPDAGASASLSADDPGLDYVRMPPGRDLWRIPASAIRRGLDYLRYLESTPTDADALRAEARERAPRLLRALLFLPPFRWRFGRRALGWLLRRLEAGLPIARATKALIRERSPDVIVVSGGAACDPEADFIRSAHAARTPSVLAMGAIELANRGRPRDVPTLTLVGGQEQVNEAVRLHGLPRERIQAVGAETSDGILGPSPAEVVEAVDRVALAEEVPRPPGRLLRPVLWLLTPLLLIVLPVLRPRATLRALGRVPTRVRKRIRGARRDSVQRRAIERKARATSAKQEKRARAEVRRQRKLSRAAEKRQKRERRDAEKPSGGKRPREAEDGAGGSGEAAAETSEPTT